MSRAGRSSLNGPVSVRSVVATDSIVGTERKGSASRATISRAHESAHLSIRYYRGCYESRAPSKRARRRTVPLTIARRTASVAKRNGYSNNPGSAAAVP